MTETKITPRFKTKYAEVVGRNPRSHRNHRSEADCYPR